MDFQVRRLATASRFPIRRTWKSIVRCWKRGQVPIVESGPENASHDWYLTPFPALAVPVVWYVWLLPDTHASVDVDRLPVNVTGGIGKQKDGRAATNIRVGNLSVGCVQFHPGIETRVPIEHVGQRRSDQAGCDRVDSDSMRGQGHT